MAHLIESYSLQTGLKIDKPYININFYPLPFDKYITIHNSSGMESKNYSYWQDVIDIISPQLKKLKINIIQIGGSEDARLDNCLDLCGKTHIYETAYILKNSLLHIGNDSFSAHMAAAFDVAVVIPYGPTTSSNHGPFFGKAEKILIEPDRQPSFSKNEFPKTVDITPIENLANNILNYLKNYFDSIESSSFETKFIGSLFGSRIIEYIPNFFINPSLMKDGTINVRMDYHFDENFLLDVLTKYKCHIITKNPINLDLIHQFSPKITMISYEIDDDADKKYIDKLSKITSKVQLITEETEQEKLSEIRFSFFDYEIKQDLPQISNLKLDNCDELWYKTYKMILSDDKIYLSKQDWLNGDSVKSLRQNSKKITTLNEEFLKESKFFLIFKK